MAKSENVLHQKFWRDKIVNENVEFPYEMVFIKETIF